MPAPSPDMFQTGKARVHFRFDCCGFCGPGCERSVSVGILLTARPVSELRFAAVTGDKHISRAVWVPIRDVIV